MGARTAPRAAATNKQERHGERLGDRDSTKPRGIGDDELRGEREKVVEHGADKCQRRDHNDAENRMHPLTLLAGRS